MPAEEPGPTVVATAMPLSATARADLSEMLGTGYAVVDIRSAPRSTNILLTPVVSQQLLGSLRAMFPRARILFTELHDDRRGISFSGPLSHIVARGPDGYFVTHTLDALGPIVQSEARLQLAGSSRRTPPRLSPAPSPARERPPTAGLGPATRGRNASTVIWIDREAWPAVPPGHWLDLDAIDDLVVRVTAATSPRDDALWPALAAECAVRLATGQDEDVLVDVGGLAPPILAEVQIRVASERVPHGSWPRTGPDVAGGGC